MHLFLIPVLVIALLSAPAARAAPTCQDRDGITTRCGTTGAMPVGWTPSPEQLSHRRTLPEPGTGEIVELFCGIGLLLALIALLPRFDGTKPGDWDRQEGDDDGTGRRL